MKKSAIRRFTLLALVIACSYSLLTMIVGAQQAPSPKFHPAPKNVTDVKHNIYTISFTEKVSEEDFERELQRILETYNAVLADPLEAGTDPNVKVKIPFLRLAALKVSEVRAKQIAEDDAIESVTQVYTPVSLDDKKISG